MKTALRTAVLAVAIAGMGWGVVWGQAEGGGGGSTSTTAGRGGGTVTVSGQAEKVSGTILGVEKKEQKVGAKDQVIETRVLNLLTGGGTIRALEMESVGSIELEDPQLQKELHAALSALVAARDQ